MFLHSKVSGSARSPLPAEWLLVGEVVPHAGCHALLEEEHFTIFRFAKQAESCEVEVAVRFPSSGEIAHAVEKGAREVRLVKPRFHDTPIGVALTYFVRVDVFHESLLTY